MFTLLKHIAYKRLKAGSLFYALIVSLLIGIMSTGMITLTFSNKYLNQKDELSERFQRNAVSGIQLLKNGSDPLSNPALLDLYGQGIDNIEIEKKEWGLFSIGISKAFSNKNQITKTIIAQFGKTPGIKSKSAINLTDSKKPLVIVGDTYIKGDVFLPEVGIKSGSIQGIGFQNEQLVHGKIQTSQKYFPEVFQSKVSSIFNYSKLKGNHALYDSLIHSFIKEPIIIKKEILVLDEHYIKGNVLMVADSLIYIGPNTKIEDAILVAPYIFIDDQFTGNLQAFATQQIEVGKEVRLTYPSVLGLIKTIDSEDEPLINIESDCYINGLVWLNNNFENKKFPRLKIGANSKIEGQVHANGTVELGGHIYGHISCRSFFLRYGAGSYSNYLMDNEINVNRCSKHYLSPQSSENKNQSTGIVKWLY